MVSGIRTIEKALGDGIKRPTPSEQANLPVVRKSLVAACPIRAGEFLRRLISLLSVPVQVFHR